MIVSHGIWRIEPAGDGYVKGALRLSFSLPNGFKSDGRSFSRENLRDLQRALNLALGPYESARRSAPAQKEGERG